ncbi:hypothetical protein MMC19_002255 [Ptychographa xylographoides]|nr:hypothetical protein [Ptychographa xylographoides]
MSAEPDDVLTVLHWKVATLVGQTPAGATGRFLALSTAIRNRSLVIVKGYYPLPNIYGLPQYERSMTSWWRGTIFVLLLAAPKHNLDAAIQFYQDSMAPPPPAQGLAVHPRHTLRVAYEVAKAKAEEACGGRTTVVGVGLVDMQYMRMKPELQRLFTAFTHELVIGIGPRGMRIWQAWPHSFGMGLREWISGGHAGIKDWKEADEWMDVFDELTMAKSSWTPDVNAMFLECFKIDFSASCGVGKLQRAMTPEYQPYINIFRLEDVGLQDLEKFIWNTGK